MEKDYEEKRDNSSAWDKFLNFVGLVSYNDEESDEEPGEFEQKESRLDSAFMPKSRKANLVNLPRTAQDNVVLLHPKNYEDTQQIVDNIKKRKPVIVNLDLIDSELAQRILDFLSGSIYAVEGTIQKVARGIFILTPSNIDITGDMPEAEQNTNYFTLEEDEEE